MDSKGVLRAAHELLRERHFPSVVAVCSDALAAGTDDLNLRLLLARALLALRRDLEAQRELSHCLRLEPRCAEAYTLLGELALRRDEYRSAEIFLNEARRIAPDDEQARELVQVLNRWIQPTAAVEKLPAATAAVGPSLTDPGADRTGRRLAVGTELGAGAADGKEISAIRFGAYLIEIGAITPMQLQAALEYHRQSKVRIGTAVAILGYASKPTIEWAAQAFHARGRGNPGT